MRSACSLSSGSIRALILAVFVAMSYFSFFFRMVRIPFQENVLHLTYNIKGYCTAIREKSSVVIEYLKVLSGYRTILKDHQGSSQ